MSDKPDLGEITAKDLREKLGLSKSYASELLGGQRKPSLELAFRMERELGVPLSTWAPAGHSEAA